MRGDIMEKSRTQRINAASEKKTRNKIQKKRKNNTADTSGIWGWNGKQKKGGKEHMNHTIEWHLKKNLGEKKNTPDTRDIGLPAGIDPKW